MKIIKGDKYEEMTQAVELHGGQCPCVVPWERNEDTKCVCKQFKEQDYEGHCHCMRFKKIKEMSDE